jgi:hypothetical protein
MELQGRREVGARRTGIHLRRASFRYVDATEIHSRAAGASVKFIILLRGGEYDDDDASFVARFPVDTRRAVLFFPKTLLLSHFVQTPFHSRDATARHAKILDDVGRVLVATQTRFSALLFLSLGVAEHQRTVPAPFPSLAITPSLSPCFLFAFPASPSKHEARRGSRT